MGRTMRSRGVSSYRSNKRGKRSSNKLSKRLSKRRIKRSNKRSNKRLNKRSNRRLNRVSKRMRNNRKSFRKRGGWVPERLAKEIREYPHRKKEKALQALQAKKENGKYLVNKGEFDRAVRIFEEAMAMDLGTADTELPTLKANAEYRVSLEEKRTKVICVAVEPFAYDPRTKESLGITFFTRSTKTVEFFKFEVVKPKEEVDKPKEEVDKPKEEVDKPKEEKYTIYHKWDEILKFIKDLEKKMDDAYEEIENRRRPRETEILTPEKRKKNITFYWSYYFKITKAYPRLNGRVYNYISNESYRARAIYRIELINKYFEVLSGKHNPNSNSVQDHLVNFGSEDELLDLMSLASQTTYYAEHFNTFFAPQQMEEEEQQQEEQQQEEQQQEEQQQEEQYSSAPASSLDPALPSSSTPSSTPSS